MHVWVSQVIPAMFIMAALSLSALPISGPLSNCSPLIISSSPHILLMILSSSQALITWFLSLLFYFCAMIVAFLSCCLMMCMCHFICQVNRLQSEGYYGGVRLLMSICKVFYNYCNENNIELSRENFTLSYDTNIPRQVHPLFFILFIL